MIGHEIEAEVDSSNGVGEGTDREVIDPGLGDTGDGREIHTAARFEESAGSDLVATLASRVAAMFSETLGLVCMPLPIPKFQIAVAWHERSHRDAPHRWFREQLIAVATEIR